MLQVTIDRFEGNMAIVEIDKDHFSKLPEILVHEAKEGDVINITAGKLSQYYIAKIDDYFVYVLTPKGKYAMPHDVSDNAKVGDYLAVEIDSTATEIKTGKIHSLMGSLFE